MQRKECKGLAEGAIFPWRNSTKASMAEIEEPKWVVRSRARLGKAV